MPYDPDRIDIPPQERRHEVAAILARGIFRLRHIARIGGNMHAPVPQKLLENGLEFPAEARLSVPDGTRGLRLRDEGDNA